MYLQMSMSKRISI